MQIPGDPQVPPPPPKKKSLKCEMNAQRKACTPTAGFKPVIQYGCHSLLAHCNFLPQITDDFD